MSITPELSRMLAERAAGEAERERAAKLDRKWDRIIAEVMEMIDKAAPHMDEGADPAKWSPSSLLKIMYFTGVSSEADGAEKRAIQSVLAMLDRARERFVNGFSADPWPDEPRPRAMTHTQRSA